jgi:hypothetical protein
MNLELLIVAILLIVLFFKLYLDKTNVLGIIVLLDLPTLAKLAKSPIKGITGKPTPLWGKKASR